MAIDPATIQELCEAIFEDDSDVARIQLTELASSDPAGCLEACRVAAIAAKTRSGDASEYWGVIEALREVDLSWFHRAIELVPSEPAMWDAMWWPGRYEEIVEYLGIAAISRAWHDDMRTEDWSSWAVSLLSDVEAWADEERHRVILLQLIENSDDETIWDTAAGPLEDFITDDPVFRRRVVDHADRIAWVEKQARTNPKFRHALTGVWITGMSAELADRVDRARNHEQN